LGYRPPASLILTFGKNDNPFWFLKDSPGTKISGMDHETLSVWHREFQRRKAAGIGVFEEFGDWPMPGGAGTRETINIATQTQTRPDRWLHAADDR
jgi:hypothetical protein